MHLCHQALASAVLSRLRVKRREDRIMNTMNSIANNAALIPAICLKSSQIALKIKRTRPLHWLMISTCGLLLVACATPQPPALKAVYDFGPVLGNERASAPAHALRLPAIALPEIEAGAGLDSPAMLYRLQYLDAQQLRPYAQARWSVPPAQLVRARLRDALSAQGAVLSTEGNTAWVMRLELDEFSQLFASPESSQGLVRLRASLFKNEQLVAQTAVVARANAASPDAAGGVRALTAATDDAVRQLSAWLAKQWVEPPTQK
jgi:cholesterol transport system auxiliary component